MNYNNPQHNTQQYSCTPFPILKEGDTSNGIVTYLDLINLGTIAGFGVDLTQIGGNKRWDNTSITAWQTLFEAIDAHLKVFDAKLKELENNSTPSVPSAITIEDIGNNKLKANVDVTWSSNNTNIVVEPTTGYWTEYSLKEDIVINLFSLTRTLQGFKSPVTFYITWAPQSKTFNGKIIAEKSGMSSASYSVSLTKYPPSNYPERVYLTYGPHNIKTILMSNAVEVSNFLTNGNGEYVKELPAGTYDFVLVDDNYNIISNSTSVVIEESQEQIIITHNVDNHELTANVDNVHWSSNSNYITVDTETGQSTTYMLSDSATSYGSFTLTADKSEIEEGENITITAQWSGKTKSYIANITASKSGMTSATESVTLYKDAVCPTYVDLDNGERITLDNGYGTLTYTPTTVRSYTVKTTGNETQGSCNFTVVAASQSTQTYYWYVGNIQPTASTNPATQLAIPNPNYPEKTAIGWHEESSKPQIIRIFNDTEPTWNRVQWYLAAPAEWEYKTTSNGTPVAGWDISTITINGTLYTVWALQSLANAVVVQLM